MTKGQYTGNFPCGLDANTMFNDTFRLLNSSISKSGGITETGIAWESDLTDTKLKAPATYPSPLCISNETECLYERYPDIIKASDGLKNEHFAVWMRLSSFGNLRKRYGTIELTRDIMPGEFIHFQVNSTYPVAGYGGTKA